MAGYGVEADEDVFADGGRWWRSIMMSWRMRWAFWVWVGGPLALLSFGGGYVGATVVS